MNKIILCMFVGFLGFQIVLTSTINNELKILNGDFVTDPSRYPYMVSIQRNLAKPNETVKRWDHHCGGSIISPQHVLTAGHCMEMEANVEPEMRVLIGEININDDLMAIPIQFHQVIVHPLYNLSSNLPNDIAIIRLPTPIDTQIFKPVCLETRSAADPVAEDVFLLGFGKFECGNDSKSENLRISRGQNVNNTECNRILNGTGNANDFVTSSQICAKYGNNSNGEPTAQFTNDSGGPLLAEKNVNGSLTDVQIGIVSWSVKIYEPSICPNLNYPGVYTRVSSFLNFIIHDVGVNAKLC